MTRFTCKFFSDKQGIQTELRSLRKFVLLADDGQCPGELKIHWSQLKLIGESSTVSMLLLIVIQQNKAGDW
jgi:hypothetical protein